MIHPNVFRAPQKLADEKKLFCSIGLLLLSIASGTANANFEDFLENTLKLGGNAKYGQINFNLRYRYENANTIGTPRKTANASMIRMRLGYLTPKFTGFQGFAEWEVNQDAGANNYSSSRNGSLRKN